MEAVGGLIDWVAPWHWLALGLALLVVERVTRVRAVLWVAIGAWLTGLVSLFIPLTAMAQVAVCVAVTAICALAAWRLRA